MKKIITLFTICCCLGHASIAQKANNARLVKSPTGIDDRKFWLAEMDKMVRPVMRSLAHDSLRINMPAVVSIKSDNPASRREVAYLEILGRTLSGIAPWLQLEGGSKAEMALRTQYRQWAIQGLQHALDSTSKDFMRFDLAGQQLVDASFLTLAFIRAPWLWDNLDATSRQRLVAAVKLTRRVKPPMTNWLLFCAMNEAFFARFDLEWDPKPVDFAMTRLESWYRGDGMYSDGERFAFDYYNSYVIHPYLAAITEVFENKKDTTWHYLSKRIHERNQRYAVIQERLINTDGTFPPTGRSIIYRGAAFHHLADIAWRKKLPESLSPASVRCALTAVIRKTLESPTTYSKTGWLTIGLYGSQPHIADWYNNSGSPYLCSAIFLPLGLPGTDAFWTAPAEKWSAQKIWTGEDFPADHGIR
ncbi:DUF2264 domain-containing protein [Filimonas effusa]|uniref:DUF2264 domain-containing protein n=1 Tax=Filimonas effusa TaxID=2508721 RepID=A0A4V1MAI7_9BACT|nr:DUF2264 domain-containing protein [Filimonas effusa]RXK86016.1 DUF2264 domain-containing protein [Filimonas effusa]